MVDLKSLPVLESLPVPKSVQVQVQVPTLELMLELALEPQRPPHWKPQLVSMAGPMLNLLLMPQPVRPVVMAEQAVAAVVAQEEPAVVSQLPPRVSATVILVQTAAMLPAVSQPR